MIPHLQVLTQRKQRKQRKAGIPQAVLCFLCFLCVPSLFADSVLNTLYQSPQTELQELQCQNQCQRAPASTSAHQRGHG
jgi:hypothetical protein